MIFGATHWLLAVGIALSIHLAGILWLSFPHPAPENPAERSGESIVVTLGREAARAADDAQELAPDESRSVSVSAAAGGPRSETATVSPLPEVSRAVTARAVTDLETMDSPETVDADVVPDAADPEPASTARTTVPEPVSVTPQVAVTRETTRVEAPESDVARDVSEDEPAVPDAREVPESAEAKVSEPSPDETVAVDIPARSASADIETKDRVPTEFADAVAVPEPSASGAEVEQATTGDVVTTEATDVAVPSLQGTESSMDVVEEPPALNSNEAAPAPGVDAVVVTDADEAAVEVVAARRPDPEVDPATGPEVRDAVEPEVIDLQALQEQSGGSGVTARYAGVLKGWLQKNMHYPRAARLAGQEGEVVVRFVIDRDGTVQSIRVESKSGFPLLDREAREMIERGDPFPGIPEDMPGQQLEVRVPVNFHVRDETLNKEIPPIYLE